MTISYDQKFDVQPGTMAKISFCMDFYLKLKMKIFVHNSYRVNTSPWIKNNPTRKASAIFKLVTSLYISNAFYRAMHFCECCNINMDLTTISIKKPQNRLVFQCIITWQWESTTDHCLRSLTIAIAMPNEDRKRQ